MLKREHEASLSALRQRVVSHEDNNAQLTSANAELKAANELFRSKVMQMVPAQRIYVHRLAWPHVNSRFIKYMHLCQI